MTTKLIFSFLLALITMSTPAQTTNLNEGQKTEELRQQIGIDYSMPDFDTKKIDGKVIGVRLAKMLQILHDNYIDNVYRMRLSNILCEQNDKLRFASIEKYKITRITKTGDVIAIRMKVWLDKKSSEVKSAELIITFNKGVSENHKVNDLFTDLRRYIKE